MGRVAELTTNMKASICMASLEFFRGLFHHAGAMEVMGTELASVESVTHLACHVALAIALAALMWRRNRWGFLGGMVLAIVGVILGSFKNIATILGGGEVSTIMYYSEPLGVAIGIIYLFFGYRAYKEIQTS